MGKQFVPTTDPVLTHKLMVVTPEMAGDWLTRNTHNRPLRKHYVHRIARAIKAGEWQLSHQGIAFAPDGTLLDGQHRLHAIIEAGVAVPMDVAFNSPPESFAILDGQQIRSIGDKLGLAGVDNPRAIGGVTRSAIINVRNPNYVKPSFAEVKAFLDEHMELVSQLVAAWGTRGTHFGIIGCAINAVLKRHASVEFMIDLGARYHARDFNLGAGDPIARLHAVLQAKAGTWSSTSKAYRFAVTALRAEIEGRQLGVIRESDKDWTSPLLPRSSDA